MQDKSIFNSIFISREVVVGNVSIGHQNPIRVQSMTSTDTKDIKKTVCQSIKMIGAGCELVRIATPSLKEVTALAAIHKELRKQGFETPLIADVHFNPKVAEQAARIVEKVRINPGNYVDRKTSHQINFSDSEYKLEQEKIADKLYPLLKICQEYNTAIRIGTNHGSLSQRILAKYGDTPLGMVESALEFVKICEGYNFQNIVLSMKSSNLKIMVQSYRLLVNRMLEENMDYPLHLGVTEAGNGMEGRIKSAVGIGTLLEENIGDTIRVSLTENPEKEIPVAKSILKKYNPNRRENAKNTSFVPEINPFEYNKRKTDVIGKIGGKNVTTIIGSDIDKKDIPDKVRILSLNQKKDIGHLKNLFASYIRNQDKTPVIFKAIYESISDEDFIIRASIDFGSLLIDGMGDGVWIENQTYQGDMTTLSEQILQACGNRITKAEFIACPSCGRTQYDIQGALEKIKSATKHLSGLKIAVMGCVVNGPGEMADAHYGYIGVGKGKVNLYKSRILVKKHVPEENAVDELIRLIKINGDWESAE